MTDDLVFRLKQMEEFFHLDYHRIKKIGREAANRIENLEAALSLAQDWIENRAIHAGDLCTSHQCVCGKALVLFNARKALDAK